ncbi:MAG: DUF3794 domain-containing protein [Pelosinus sp.]|nr:DUF3794 domain-containing protein [Pelosinus sp.]
MEECQRPIVYNKSWIQPCYLPKMVVNQVVGQGKAQESLTIHLCIPQPKPSAQQIIDVFVKKLRITHVQVTTDCVIVRGDFELKAIYVACKPTQPVHAVEARCVRFTAHVPICGVRCGMEADAAVSVEYVDYDCDYHTRKGHTMFAEMKSTHIEYGQHEFHQGHHAQHEHQECLEETAPCCCHPYHKHCVRRFEAAVVLSITAKVVIGREIALKQNFVPKG